MEEKSFILRIRLCYRNDFVILYDGNKRKIEP